MAVAAPIPSPSVSTTVAKNAGRRKNVRAASLRSRAKIAYMESLGVVFAGPANRSLIALAIRSA